MRRLLLSVVVIVFAASIAALAADDTRPILVVRPFTAAEGVSLPYDAGQLQLQLVAELKVLLGRRFDVTAHPPTDRVAYVLHGRITGWRAGNVAKRLIIGLGSGRESADLAVTVKSSDGRTLLEKSDTIRTNFYSQSSGSTGTLAHPFAQKIADRLEDLELR